MGEVGGSGLGGHFPMWLQLATRPQGMSGLLRSPLPSAGHTGKMQPKGCFGVGCSHSREQAAFPGRQAGNQGRRCRGGEGHGRMEGDEDGDRSPFPGSPGPALGQWRHALHPQSLRQSQLPPLPTCPAVPFLQSPPPVPCSCGEPSLLTPHQSF